MNIEDKELLYINAKKAYYLDTPIMTDEEFDRLEDELVELNSKLPLEVGALSNTTIKEKLPHFSPMLSLAKIKIEDDNIEALYKSFCNWQKNYSKCIEYELSPKYDGNAVNLIYKKSKLVRALTRGDGSYGKDVSDKLVNVPKHLSVSLDYTTIEIRGEVVIKTDIFEKNYSNNSGLEKTFKNPRNFVAGVLNSDSANIDLHHIVFIPFEIKAHKDDKTYDYLDLSLLAKMSFKDLPYIIKHKIDKIEEFEKMFRKFSVYREKISLFQLDGFVLKVIDSKSRKEIGENGHHPNWALAVKFAPKEAKTKIIGIEWSFGKTGKFTPIGLLEPVDLDGSTVSRVSLANYGMVKESGLFPGAEITLVKSGDIIPAVKSIIKSSNNYSDIPEICPYCNTPLSIESNLHLICTNKECRGLKFFKFKYSIEQLKLNFFGEKIIDKLFINGLRNALELFDKSKFNKDFLKNIVGDGKAADRLIKEVRSVNKIELATLIRMFSIDAIGVKTSNILALKVSGLNYDSTGIQKDLLNLFDEGSKYRILLDKYIAYLEKKNIKVISPIELDVNAQTYEMTGSPKDAGFNSKSDFIEFAKSLGFENSKLTDKSSFLITDSLDSTSSKMAKAKKLNVTILTYSRFKEIYGKR